ncbi:uncharacterized protein LOC122004619 [Zingiber officinale]|uniref:uncharacterized protein LOC122004619 n=1 Tax=Zingiber officinale TaxID=94328 RepID=UPI001C4D50BB|nr:uncharacterized protein LOC122004619 [Zingiber officinale]
MSSSHEGEVSLDLSLQIGPPTTDDLALSDISMFQRPREAHQITSPSNIVCLVNPYFRPSPMQLPAWSINHHRRHDHHLELQVQNYRNAMVRSRLMAFEYPTMKQSARAPRMRWTSSLHAHFVNAVHLLGGHEKATPKSILELMDVKGLTLAHVKSHLQMYRALNSSDKPTASTGSSFNSVQTLRIVVDQMAQILFRVMVRKGKIQAWNSPWEDQAGNPHCSGTRLK